MSDQTSTESGWGSTPPPPGVRETTPPPPQTSVAPAAQHQQYAQQGDTDLDQAYTQRPPEPQQSGFLGWVQRLFGRKAKPPSPEETQREQNLSIIRTPTHSHRVAVASHKGGIGKTTTSLALGTVLSMYRHDQTVVIDANPDIGTLGNQLAGYKTHDRTIRDLVANADAIRSVQDVRQFTHTAPSRLEVLASDQDPQKARSTSREDYDLAQAVLGTFRDIVITDTGIDMTASIYDGIIDYTDTLVIAATTAKEDARLAKHALRTWYERGTNNRGAALVPNAVVAIRVKNEGENVSTDHLRQSFESIARKVVFIPHDPYLDDGRQFDWDSLRPATQDAFIELSAAVAEGFQHP